MSDAKLRELERRWKETGSVEDEAAYLLERVRVGDLTRERLELAAYCGHEGARRAVGTGNDDELVERVGNGTEAGRLGVSEDCLRLFRGLERWGRPVIARALMCAVAFVDPHEAQGALASSILRWCNCPCGEHGNDTDRLVPRDATIRSSPVLATGAFVAQASFVDSNPGEAARLMGSMRVLLLHALSAVESKGFPTDRVCATVRRELSAWSLAADVNGS